LVTGDKIKVGQLVAPAQGREGVHPGNQGRRRMAEQSREQALGQAVAREVCLRVDISDDAAPKQAKKTKSRK
jgi:hypothetical protein